MTALRFVYLTMPENNTVVLNINDGSDHNRYKINRDQLLQLNEQIVEVVTKNKFDKDGAQLVLSLEKAATL
jgi:hypothetical protein